MNKKGQASSNTIGAIIVAFVTVIVGIAVVFQGGTSAIGTLTQTSTNNNQTITFPANGVNTSLIGQSVSAVVITNATSGAIVPATNYTISNNVLLNNELVGRIQGLTGDYNGRSVNISYTYEPFGYQTSTGNRTIVQLILIFAGLGIALAAFIPAVRSGVLSFMGVK